MSELEEPNYLEPIPKSAVSKEDQSGQDKANPVERPGSAPSSNPNFVPRAPRIDVNREFNSIDQFISEYITNVSTTGAFIKSSDPLPVGTEVSLRFTILAEDVETIEGVGRVVRVSESPPGMGVVFTQLTRSSKELLRHLLTTATKGSAK